MMRKTALIAHRHRHRGRMRDAWPAGARAGRRARRMAASADTYKNLSLFGDVFDKVRADYVEKPDEQKLVENAINGMLTSLDPHSSYLDAKGFKDMRTQTEGKFGGLGIEVTQEDGFVKVVTPIDDTPASRAGVMSGDLIGAIDDESVQGLTLNQAVDKMRGAINTTVKLTILRGKDKQKIDVKLTRAEIHIKSVRSRKQDEDIGYIRISQFNEETADGLASAMPEVPAGDPDRQVQGLYHRSAQQSGRPARPIDPGGQRLHRPWRDRFDARPQRRRNATLQRPAGGDFSKGKPVVVLINGGSASASEIVAGALAGSQARDADRHALLRQGLGADDHPARRRQWRAASDHGALLHAVGPLDPGQGHRSRHHHPAGRAGRAEGQGRHQGRSVAEGPSQEWRRREDRLAGLCPAGREEGQAADRRRRSSAWQAAGADHRPSSRRTRLQGHDRQGTAT